MTLSPRWRPASAPIKVDLTGGLGDVELDMAELAAKAREEMTSGRPPRKTSQRTRPSPRVHPAARLHSAPPPWADLDDPRILVVIVGGAELGPFGSSRTRFEMEVDDELSAAGVPSGLDHRPDQVGGRSRTPAVRHRNR